MKPRYDQCTQLFATLVQELRQQGVLESDLPFLYEYHHHQTGILLLHGSAASPCNNRELGDELFQRGYTVLSGLLSGHGLNHNEALHQGHVTWEDCYQSAVEYLHILEGLVERVYVVGSSFGGTLAYAMGIHQAQILDGVVALSAPAVTGRRRPDSPWMTQIANAIRYAEEHLAELELPTLILHGVDDSNVKVKNALYAYDQVGTRQKKLIIYDQIGHSLGFGYNTAEVAQDIHHFITSYPSPQEVSFSLRDRSWESVHVVGDFNDWNQTNQPLALVDGVWQTEIWLPAGRYQYKFLLNQSEWLLDPESPTVSTPNGGKNSCKVVKSS